MADCEKMERCLFFNDRMADRPATAELMKNRFCRREKSSCARYQVASSGKPVPPTLYPNQTDRVREIVSST